MIDSIYQRQRQVGSGIILGSFQCREVLRICTVELQWLKHLWNHENMFETVVVRANECVVSYRTLIATSFLSPLEKNHIAADLE